MLPGPWQDSHPTFFELSPGAFKRVWVALLKPFTMSSWHSAQVCEPTNSAPGMFGGASTVRLTVPQEIAITVIDNTAETAIRRRRFVDLFLDSPSWTGRLFDEDRIGVSVDF